MIQKGRRVCNINPEEIAFLSYYHVFLLIVEMLLLPKPIPSSVLANS